MHCARQVLWSPSRTEKRFDIELDDKCLNHGISLNDLSSSCVGLANVRGKQEPILCRRTDNLTSSTAGVGNPLSGPQGDPRKPRKSKTPVEVP